MAPLKDLNGDGHVLSLTTTLFAENPLALPGLLFHLNRKSKDFKCHVFFLSKFCYHIFYDIFFVFFTESAQWADSV